MSQTLPSDSSLTIPALPSVLYSNIPPRGGIENCTHPRLLFSFPDFFFTYLLLLYLVYYLSTLLELVKFCVGRDFHSVPDTQKMRNKYFLNKWMISSIVMKYIFVFIFYQLGSYDMRNLLVFCFPPERHLGYCSC